MTPLAHANDHLSLSLVSADSDLTDIARLVSLAFGGDLPGCHDWIANGGASNLRLLRDASAGAVATPACLMRIPMGAFFGGKSVPLLGIAGVAVAPECRGRGLALRLMREAMRQAADDGFALSGLYASTQALYRQVGFEQAGDRCHISLRLPTLGLRERGGPITPITDADMPAVKACYTHAAARFNGPLDRGDYLWNRIRKWRDKTYTGFAARDDAGDIRGYLFMNQARKDSGKFDLILSDFAAVDADGYRRLLGFLADFAMMGESAQFHAGPHHPALMLLPQQSFDIHHHEFWMLRVLNVKSALETRGWSACIRGRVELDLADELLPANHGRWTLEVDGGRATCVRGGAGTLRMNIRALGPLLSGLQSATGLALAGLIASDSGEDALRNADGVFATTAPWTGDFY